MTTAAGSEFVENPLTWEFSPSPPEKVQVGTGHENQGVRHEAIVHGCTNP
jgi:hypothetical protein